MTSVRVFIVIGGFLLLAASLAEIAAQEGIALAIVYDNSGSMKQAVRTAKQDYEPKYRIANRALLEVVKRIESFATNSVEAPARKVHAGLFVFAGSGAKEVVQFGPFNGAAMRAWVKSYPGPGTGTPLGTALESASKAVLASPLARKHVLVITDGINTVGPDPVRVVPQVQKAGEAKGAVVFLHFVAFDIDARHFAPLKKLGVTVVGAADENQLDQQLGFILEEKILLEKETK